MTIIQSGEAGQHPVVLLGADRILPNGDVGQFFPPILLISQLTPNPSVNKTGSLVTAWAGHQVQARVMVVTRADKVQSANAGLTFDPEANAGAELCAAWFASATTSESADQMKNFVTGSVEKEVLKITNTYFEKIPVSVLFLFWEYWEEGG